MIGGDAGGMAAATQARRLDPSLEIVAFEKTEWTSYSACGIPYVVSGEIESVERPRSPARRRSTGTSRSIDVPHPPRGHGHRPDRWPARGPRPRATVAPSRCRSTARPRAWAPAPSARTFPGIDLPIVHGVQTLHDASQLLQYAETSRCSDVVVVGGGYIGLELAEAFVERQAKRNGRREPDARDEHARRRHGDTDRGSDAQARHRSAVEHSSRRLRGRRVSTRDGTIKADLVVLGIGVEPNSELARRRRDRARRSPVRARRSVASEPVRRTCGPPAIAPSRSISSAAVHVHIALGTVANRQGRVAGINIGGGYATFPGVLGTASPASAEPRSRAPG